jgi:alpha-1,3-rhamnosyl/mannosyltransferase
MSRNLLPLLPRRELELSAGDRVRVRALRLLYSIWARRARRTVCVSSHARDRLSRLARIDARAITVIPHGVDAGETALECSTPALELVRAKPYVLHVGQPVPYRRTRELFAAFALLANRTPNVPPLVVAGKARPSDRGYEQACLESLADLLRDGRAVLLGQVSHADALALMGKAHVFGYPSVHEDCPNVVLEALSAGRVGVYADIPAVRELAADAGIFVGDPGVTKLAEALERALFDETERARIATAAVGRATLFTWDQTAERTAAVLEQAAA